MISRREGKDGKKELNKDVHVHITAREINTGLPQAHS